MIRTILFFIFAFLFLITSPPLMLVEWIVGKINPGAKDRSSLAIVKFVFRVMLFISGTRIVVLGKEKVPTDTAVLYVGNHRSIFDVLVSYIQVPRPTGYVSKIEIKKIPFLRVWMRYLHCLFLDRKDIKQGLKTILTGVDMVKSGISVCIYPEGTRSKEKDVMLPFHDGSFKIAEKGDVLVIPITTLNSDEVFEAHMPRMKKATVVLSYGDPIYLKDLDKETRKKPGAYVAGIIADTYAELKKEYDL